MEQVVKLQKLALSVRLYHKLRFINRVKLLITILFIPFLSAFSQSWTYSNSLQGDGNITAIKSSKDTENNILVFGHFDENLSTATGESIITSGGIDYFMAKFDQFGNTVWLKKLGSSENEDIQGGLSTSYDNSIYVTGGFQGQLYYTDSDFVESTGNYDVFFAKIDPEGNIIYCKNIGAGSHLQRSTALKVDEFGDIIIGGFYRDSIKVNNDTTIYSNTSNNNIFYLKLDPIDGDLKWIKSINSINNVAGGRIYNISSSNNAIYFTGIYSDSTDFQGDTLISTNNSFDAYILKTDGLGDIEWIREIKGDNNEFVYSLAFDFDNNIYITGYQNNFIYYIDSTDTEIRAVDLGVDDRGFDFLIAKYDDTGDLHWIRNNGGLYDDKLVHSTFYKGELLVSGFYTDSIKWGGIIHQTKGEIDKDMFVGALDTDGNYRSSNSYGGRNNSEEDGRAIFNDGENIYTVIRSNSDLLVLGDEIYTSSTGKFYVAFGIIGCLPISIDNVIVNDVNTCYGDSTGSLQILATGGFGSPYQYSIDNGLSYQNNAYFQELPAGNYPVIVIDQENCTQEGPIITVGQPDTLRIELVSTADITNEADGSIVVAATGGTTPYTFTLLPDNLIQGFGTYTFQPGDSGRYVVQVNDAKNCGPVETDSIDIMDYYGVGFEDISDLKLRIYPNPSSNLITLEMPLDETEVTLEVLSLTGQVMMSHQVYPSGGVLRETIDVSELSKGMYMLRVNGKTLRSGVVVN